MSLLINAESVAAVLIAGEWHDCEPKSFTLDSYEFAEDDGQDAFVLHAGGRSGVCATGFQFTDKRGATVYGPLTSVQAVRTAGRHPVAPRRVL